MQWSKRSYTLFSLVSTLLEKAVLAAVVLLLLPRFGINIPVRLLIPFMVAWTVYSYITFRLGKKVIDRTPLVGAETLISTRGIATTPLSPEGYVRVGSELWRACSLAGEINEKVEVTVKDRKELTLLVVPSTGTSSDNGQICRSETTALVGHGGRATILRDCGRS